ncbi:TagK domain-containing protein [Burkholderia sp. MSMB1498]|uniref:TagK domain-containing protein n=1 Tax=Burkholderia sp. MSMB1498 TaxID=1637842 RepID=UPI0007599DF9|nr:TagK domain-containing protein [Burkholderia sp. MSMB1498]KVK76465.1 type VI secretion protein [Burkholderia sp. MSMB1498]
MRTFKLFRRNGQGAQYAESASRDAGAASRAAGRRSESIVETLLIGPSDTGQDDSTHDGGAVFGLIGTTIAAEAFASRPERAATDVATAAGAPAPAGDLVHSLYEQYCRALEDPQAPLTSDWAARLAVVHAPPPEPAVARIEEADGTGAIDALLSGARVLDDAFGSLGSDGAPDPAGADSTPEVLRLFAPAEYRAAAARRPGGLPPALARREHHALAIDSPLPAPGAASNQDAR